MDHLTQQARSANMAKVKGVDTRPELAVRRVLHALGYRFRLHRRDLPGRPDIVLPKFRTVIFVHGCFWHRHRGCKRTTTPHTRTDFWQTKFARTVERDLKQREQLEGAGWRVVTLWECATGDREALATTLKAILTQPR